MNKTFKILYSILICAMLLVTTFVHVSADDDHFPVLLSTLGGELSASGDFIRQ